MANKHIPIPEESKIVENGMITRIWYQFLYKIFGNIFDRIGALESTAEDHETRIDALENP